MNYTQYADKTQVFSAFASVEACQNAVSVKDNALLLYDFVQFCRVADPLFSAVWGADWMGTPIYMGPHSDPATNARLTRIRTTLKVGSRAAA